MSTAERIVKSLRYLSDNGLKSEAVSDEEALRRIAICEGCEKFRSMTRQCSICNCFMDVKTKLKFDPVRSVAQGETLETVCPDNPQKW